MAASHSNSAATIEHEEVHIDITKHAESKPAISQGQIVTSQHKVGYNNSNSQVTVGDTPIVFQPPLDPKDKPKDFVVTSCFVILLCNFIFGFLGYHFGVKANHAWQLGDEVVARKHAKKAKIFAICGIIAGVCTYVLAITLFFTLSKSRFL